MSPALVYCIVTLFIVNMSDIILFILGLDLIMFNHERQDEQRSSIIKINKISIDLINSLVSSLNLITNLKKS